MNNIDELIKALRWISKVRTYCETHIVICRECEFHGFCTDPDSDESTGKQADWTEQAADAIEALQAENISLRAERDALLKAVEKPSVQERGD